MAKKEVEVSDTEMVSITKSEYEELLAFKNLVEAAGMEKSEAKMIVGNIVAFRNDNYRFASDTIVCRETNWKLVKVAELSEETMSAIIANKKQVFFTLINKQQNGTT